MDSFLMIVTLALYLASTAASVGFLLRPGEGVGRLGRRLLTVGFAVHTLSIVLFHFHHHLPAKDAAGSMALFSWVLVGFFLGFQWRYHVPAIGAFVTPVVSLLVLICLMRLHGGARELGELYRTPYFPVHVVLAFLGDASFALAACVGVMYLIQEKNVKRKHTGASYQRLPPLEMLDHLNHRMVVIGFPLLTLGMVTGALWLHGAKEVPKGVDPIILWAILTWAVYAVLVHGRLVLGWRGKRAAILSVVGFGLVLFSFVVKNWLTLGLHSLA